jgi:hypothetical protein
VPCPQPRARHRRRSDRLRVTRRDDHTRADADFVEQLLRKAKGHPHAAVRGRISGQRPAVQREAVPGEAQHVRHPGIVIEARAMVLVLLHDAEDAGWRLASRSSARHRRAQDPAVGVVDGHLLALDRYDRHDRLARGARGRPLGGMLGTGLAGRGVGGRSRRQRRQGGRGHERHNRGRCPAPDYLGGLGRRASLCHAMSRLSGRNRIEMRSPRMAPNTFVARNRVIEKMLAKREAGTAEQRASTRGRCRAAATAR